MASKYQKPYTIPDGFPALLKGFTREILRSQPENIYEFGSRYFNDLLEKGGRSAFTLASDQGKIDLEKAATRVDLTSLSTSELENLLLQIFIQADLDQSGYLDRQELSGVLRDAKLNLTERQIRQILSEADENEDNVIQYKEFLPVMIDLLQGLKAKEQAKSVLEDVESKIRGNVENMLLHGMPRHELESLMLKVFKKADVDGSGQLNRHEFKEALKVAELGLTRKDINLILTAVDTDKDGLVSYEEFVPICFQVLVERFKDEILLGDILQNEDELQQLLLHSFQTEDIGGTGLLAQRQVKSVLKKLSYEQLGLTTVQLVSLLSQAPMNSEGLVPYLQFIPFAATVIRSLYDVDNMKLRMAAIKNASAGGIKALGELDIETLKSVLEDVFMQVDVDGSGQLTPGQVMEVLNHLNTIAPENSIALSDEHMKAMFAAIDVNENGVVDWSEFVNFICDALEHIEKEKYVARLANGKNY
mmetsp:Transcript_17945/g.32766  ORF Transcript_17945/g.32766 Transcript_17945/m.32766 type:complete len:475 (+) Transcript_17945:89-1513(+)